MREITDEDRRAAVEAARAARAERAEVLGAVRSGEARVGDVLASDSAAVRRTPVKTLLRAVPGIGEGKCAAIMDEIGIDARRRVGGLGPRQRAALAARFGEGGRRC